MKRKQVYYKSKIKGRFIMKNMQEALAYINDKWNKAQKEGKLSFKITIDNGRK